MGTSSSQGIAFLRDVISQTLLEESINWIQSNMNPEDVFDESDLQIWAESNGLVAEDE